jgi:hypothetical protein
LDKHGTAPDGWLSVEPATVAAYPGVEATRVAEWVGHSVAVLLRVYAKCLDGDEQAARAKVEQAMTG